MGSTTIHDNASDSSSQTYPSVYPPLDDLVSNMHLSETHHSAPASPPAPAAPMGPSFPSKYQSISAKYDADLHGYSNSSFSSQSESSAHHSFTHSTSFAESNKGLQIVPFSTSKGSLKVLLLHGNLDIWVYEAKNLPNMDMFHKTLGDVIKLPGKVGKITSDPYVSISVRGAVIGRTYVISNSENPIWMQHFSVPVAHYDAEVHFYVKDSDILGSQLIGTVALPVEQIYSGGKLEGFFPIINASGKPCKPGAVLSLSIQYTPIESLSIYHHGVGTGPHYGVPSTYFPLRKGGTVTLYQDAHVPDGALPNFLLDNGTQYVHGKCWRDIFDAVRQARRLVYITGWSVWHKVRLIRDANINTTDCTLGDLLKSKSQEGVRVLLLVWDDPTSRNIMGYKTVSTFPCI